MRRFDRGRWNRILVWTAAALAWGSALIAARSEERPQGESTEPSGGQVTSVAPQAGMPVPPSKGLVILRFTPVETPRADVTTVELGRATSSQPSAPAPAISAPAPPEPSSSGS